MRILEAIATTPWAMTADWVQTIHDIAAGDGDVSPAALEAYRASALARGERVTVRDGVAIMQVSGPLFRRANLLVEFSGASSYEILRRDLQVALDDPSVRGIVLNCDSPGGEVSGCDELAKAVFDARKVKPIVSYVGGTGASGAYWIASAASEVVLADAAIVGSIGVVLGMTDTSAQDERRGVRRVEFVSSTSPGKRPDIATDEGRARIQKTVDSLADVFIGAVARHRGVKINTVITKFGEGGLLVGADAVAAGMADRTGTLEGVISSLSAPRGVGRPHHRSNGGILMSNVNNLSADAEVAKMVAEARAEAAAKATADAQARSLAILNHADAKALPTLAASLAFKTSLSVADAEMLLADAAKDRPSVAAAEQKTPADPAQGFADRKAAAGALVGAPDAKDAPAATEQAEIEAGWAKARARLGLK